MANAQQVDFILQNKFSGNSNSTNFNGLALASGYLIFYAVGKGSLKTIWKDALKATAWTDSKVTLDTNGFASDEVYADGKYDIEIYDSDDTLIETIFNANYATTTSGTLAHSNGNTASTFSITATGTWTELDSSSNNITVSILTAVGHAGEIIKISKEAAANTVTLNPNGSETAGGLLSPILTALNESVIYISDGVNWKLYDPKEETQGAIIADSATPDIFNNTNGTTMHLAGTTTITDFPDAPSVGMWRKVIFDGIRTVTTGSGITVQGGANWTTAVNDFAWVFANTVSSFFLFPSPADGKPIVAANRTVEITLVPDATSVFGGYGGGGEFRGVNLADGVTDGFRGEFTVPDDFTTPVSLDLHWTADGTGNARFTFNSRALAASENRNSGGSTDSIAEASYAATATLQNHTDIIAAVDGLTISPGDTVGISGTRVGGSGSDTIGAGATANKMVLTYI